MYQSTVYSPNGDGLPSGSARNIDGHARLWVSILAIECQGAGQGSRATYLAPGDTCTLSPGVKRLLEDTVAGEIGIFRVRSTK